MGTVRDRNAASPYSDAPGAPRAPAGAAGDVPRGSTITVPLWAAAALFHAGVALVQTPKHYTPTLLDDFKTDATLPSVPERSPYMIEAGAAVAPFLPSAEATRVGSAALRLFLNRYQHTINVAHAKGHDLRALRNKLGALERLRLAAAMQVMEERRAWRSGEQFGSTLSS